MHFPIRIHQPQINPKRTKISAGVGVDKTEEAGQKKENTTLAAG